MRYSICAPLSSLRLRDLLLSNLLKITIRKRFICFPPYGEKKRDWQEKDASGYAMTPEAWICSGEAKNPELAG